MKRIYQILTLTLLTGFIWSCSDDDTDPRLPASDSTAGTTSITLTQPVSGGNDILTEATSSNVWETFIWESPNNLNISSKEGTPYYIQVDNQTGDFSEPAQIGPFTTTTAEVTEEMLNNALLALGYYTVTSVEAQARMYQKVNDDYKYYSAPITFTVIGYGGEDPSVENFLYVPGAHQGWDPANTYVLYSPDQNGTYSGYINFPDANTEFKFTPQPNWDNSYGTNDGVDSGTMILNDGGNLSTTTQGTALITADTNALTYTVESTAWTAVDDSWGIIGDATPTGWDSDTDMTFNQTNGLLELELTLTDGFIKFRANDGWDTNYGDPEGDGIAEPGADNIAVTAGTYLIQLDFRNPAQVTYTLTAQ
ncbi:hypothetical protein UJ101_01161 [Flavobacteriaceae bacterium UJ101]|nr:hypothetical protein UJ101_01161 [Flavobacteriaceae bacterium UJ101]